MDFPKTLLSPEKTLVFNGALSQLGQEVASFGSPGLIVHGRSLADSGRKDKLAGQFSGPLKAEFFCRQRRAEPVIGEISEVIARGRDMGACWIAGIGGGSVLDLAKAAAGLFRAKENPVYYQSGGQLKEKGITFIAVPTTAGTGAEVTKNAVIINPERQAKLSIRDDSFIARKVILDGELLAGLPREVICYSGLDAYVQAYESFISRNATWYSDSYALKAVKLIDNNIEAAYQTGKPDSLFQLLIGSYCAGMALAAARLGVIHGVAHPLGVLYGYPHGLVCASCFLSSIELNREVMGAKYEIISDVIGRDFKKRVKQLLDGFGIVSPFKGQVINQRGKIIEETLLSGSTAANPKKIVAADVEFILEQIVN